MSEQIERLKRMAVNAGATDNTDDPYESSGKLEFDRGSLARFARAIAEDCAKEADAIETPYIGNAIRNLYRDQS